MDEKWYRIETVGELKRFVQLLEKEYENCKDMAVDDDTQIVSSDHSFMEIGVFIGGLGESVIEIREWI